LNELVFFKQSDNGYLKSDTLSNQKTNIFNESGHRKGFNEKDILTKDRINIYNDKGSLKGYIRPDLISVHPR